MYVFLEHVQNIQFGPAKFFSQKVESTVVLILVRPLIGIFYEQATPKDNALVP